MQGGQMYCAFPFSKTSMDKRSSLTLVMKKKSFVTLTRSWSLKFFRIKKYLLRSTETSRWTLFLKLQFLQNKFGLAASRRYKLKRDFENMPLYPNLLEKQTLKCWFQAHYSIPALFKKKNVWMGKLKVFLS